MVPTTLTKPQLIRGLIRGRLKLLRKKRKDAIERLDTLEKQIAGYLDRIEAENALMEDCSAELALLQSAEAEAAIMEQELFEIRGLIEILTILYLECLNT